MKLKFVSNQIVFGLLCALFITSTYAQELALSLNPPSTMNRDSSYTVPIMVSNFNSVNAFQFDVLFNTNNLEILEVPKASFVSISISSSTVELANANGMMRILWVSPLTPLNYGTAELLSLKFKVRPKANVGSDSIRFANGLVVDVNSKSLNPRFYNSYVNILTGITEYSSPSSFSLSQNYPNPFNPSTTIRYHLSTESFVQLTIFDVLGNEIAQLVNEKQQAGDRNVTFDSKNSSLSSGIYFYRLDAGQFHHVRKMLLLK